MLSMDSGHWVISEKPEEFRRGELLISSFDMVAKLYRCCGIFENALEIAIILLNMCTLETSMYVQTNKTSLDIRG